MSIHTLYLPTNECNRIVMTVLLISVHNTSRLNIVLCYFACFIHTSTTDWFSAISRQWWDLFFFRLNWCNFFREICVPISLIILHSKVVRCERSNPIFHTFSSLLFYYFRYGAQLFQLRRARGDNIPVWVPPNAAAVSQVQAMLAQSMLCEINYDKYLRGKTCSFCINCLNDSDFTHEQTN